MARLSDIRTDGIVEELHVSRFDCLKNCRLTALPEYLFYQRFMQIAMVQHCSNILHDQEQAFCKCANVVGSQL